MPAVGFPFPIPPFKNILPAARRAGLGKMLTGVGFKLEGFWENHWAAYSIIAVGLGTAIYWWRRPPAPGIAVLFMGVAVALMAGRSKPTGAEKALWMVMIFAFATVETLAIRKDRREQSDAQARLL